MPIYHDPEDAEKTFNELLAKQANERKPELVHATLAAFREGDAAAMKLVTQALLESQYKEEGKEFIITDERFKQIITMAAAAISEELI